MVKVVFKKSFELYVNKDVIVSLIDQRESESIVIK